VSLVIQLHRSLESKICRDCQKRKPLTKYHRGKAYRDGLYPCCKACSALSRRQRYLKSRERVVEQSRAYYAARRGEICAKKTSPGLIPKGFHARQDVALCCTFSRLFWPFCLFAAFSRDSFWPSFRLSMLTHDSSAKALWQLFPERNRPFGTPT